MKHLDIVGSLVGLCALIFVIHFLVGAEPRVVFSQFDKVLHLMGGMACGIAGAWAYATGSFRGRTMIYALSSSFVLVIGILIWEVLWEGLGIWSPIAPVVFNLEDLAGDIVADFAGALIVSEYYFRKFQRPEYQRARATESRA